MVLLMIISVELTFLFVYGYRGVVAVFVILFGCSFGYGIQAVRIRAKGLFFLSLWK
jgi:hypothetical protein